MLHACKKALCQCHTITLQSLLSDIRSYTVEEGQISDLRYFLSDNVPVLVRMLESLNRAGHISFISEETDLEKSQVISRPHDFFSDLTLLWSSDRNTPLDDPCLISLSNLSALFPDEEPHLVAQVLTQFKLCVQVVSSRKSSPEVEKRFYIPSLLTSPAPKDVWGVKCSYSFSFGWTAEVCDSERAYSQQLMDAVLLTSLSTSVSAVSVERFSFWKNGLYLRCHHDAPFEVILEVSEDLKNVFLLMQARQFSLSCLKYRSTIIRAVRGCLKEGSSVEYRESLMDPFDTMRYPLQQRHGLTLFTVTDVLHSIQSERTVVRSRDLVQIQLSDLLHLEPVALIGRECLTLLQSACPDQCVSDLFLKAMAEAVTRLSSGESVSIFSSMFVSGETGRSQAVEGNGLYSSLLLWRDQNRTYSELLTLLRQLSFLNINQFYVH